MKTVQKSTDSEYRPTRKERLLLDAMMNPANRLKSITSLCAAAGVSRNTYYDAIAKPGFSAFAMQHARKLVGGHVLPLIHAFIHHALRGSFQHGKVLLEMTGLYSERKEVSGPGGGPVEVAFEDHAVVRKLLPELFAGDPGVSEITTGDTAVRKLTEGL